MSYSGPRLADTGMIRTIGRLAAATVALGALAVLAGVATPARADSRGPIDFESPYTIGSIDGQQGWKNTGGYDVTVAPGFGGQALQISDAVTSGSFGDQTFSPALSQPAGESGLSHFAMSFKIGTVTAGEQSGLHMTVSPDDGNGSRMSFLRFEDRADGVHVLFEDATDPGPLGTTATFNLTDVATLAYGTDHTIGLSINFYPGAGNDYVEVTIDGSLAATGTTWEDYYRYDPEQLGNGNMVPSVSKLLFREAGTANPANAGNGFLIDNLSYASSATAACVPTGFVRDGINLTAAQIGGAVTGTLDATGCNIGAYNPTSVSGATISGANYYGVVVNHRTTNIANSSVHNIGEVQFNGAQHGNAVLYINGAHGTISGSTVTSYQKNGITVSGKAANGVDPGPSGSLRTAVSVLNNVVTGQGPIDYIAQNGIQVSFGATAKLVGNNVSLNNYTPAKVTACGLLIYKAGGVSGATKSGISYVKADNNFHNNEQNICNFGKGGTFSP